MTNRLFWLKIGCTFYKIAPELFLGNFNTESAETDLTIINVPEENTPTIQH